MNYYILYLPPSWHNSIRQTIMGALSLSKLFADDNGFKLTNFDVVFFGPNQGFSPINPDDGIATYQRTDNLLEVSISNQFVSTATLASYIIYPLAQRFGIPFEQAGEFIDKRQCDNLASIAESQQVVRLNNITAGISNSVCDKNRTLDFYRQAFSVAAKYLSEIFDTLPPVSFFIDRLESGGIDEDKINGLSIGGTYTHISVKPDTKFDTIVTTIVHEYIHSYRAQTFTDSIIDGNTTLLQLILEEGIATYVEIDAIKSLNLSSNYFANAMTSTSDTEFNDSIRSISNYLDIKCSGDVDIRYKVMFDGDKKEHIPRWAGYRAGLRIVSNFANRHDKDLQAIVTTDQKAFANEII